ncbi:DUF4012 domain-containing protein [Cryobacterium sp. TMT1-3]|uniref:DUF4012 domain-containing protein n=1 Tax=Cryobacterium sp. TMT1-3 TaxID=1259237 RepID=UPI00106BBAEC|nr:DUF4012 domain-containing protein [Cryobacterium sp. TMT1-3]TFC29359.1 DUF4012 domain-containing protein [Cryobacterium sp. TMT1-3]
MRLRLFLIRVSLCVIGLVVGAAAWVGVQTLMIRADLEQAVPLASAIQQALVAGDLAAAERSAIELEKYARSAVGHASDPIWRAFEAIPLLGPNLTVVRQLTQTVEGISEDAVVPMVSLAGSVNLAGFNPVNGAVDLSPLIQAQPALASIDAALAQALVDVASIDTSQTLEQVRAMTQQLSAVVDRTATSVSSINRAAHLLPAMLGAEGPRSYLLLFQNNAEVRATGGLPGAFAEVSTENGQIRITRQASAGGIVFDEPVLDLPLETRGIYTDLVSTFMGDVTLTPQFPITGALTREMWKRTYGTEVDGVISLDPVALSYLLRATGPIPLATGEVLTSGNAVQLLLSDVYANYEDPADQDAVFASAAASVFAALAGGNADPAALISALAQAGDERRILIWSAHDEDQKLLEGTTLTGDLPVSDASAEKIGVYFNDATGAKMNTHLDTRIDLGEVTCRNDERPYYAVDVTLTNTAPPDAATSLPESVTGPGTYGVVQGNIKTLILVYGPPDSQNLGVSRAGEAIPYHPARHEGYPVSQLGVELAPGESSTTRFYFLGADAEHGVLEAVHTPVLNLLEGQKIAVGCDEVG